MLSAEFRMQNSDCGMSVVTPRGAWRRLALPACCILHFALLLSFVGCSAKAKAQTLPDGPPLAVPIAPAHEIVIEQIAEAPQPEPEPVPEVVPPKPAPVTERRQVTPPKPSPPTTPPANQPAATTQPPPSEAPVVRAAPAAGDETKARTLIARARSDLEKRVDYQRLSDEGKAQYNQSKRFSDEADQAIKDRNFLLAVTLADKAATLAAELVR